LIFFFLEKISKCTRDLTFSSFIAATDPACFLLRASRDDVQFPLLHEQQEGGRGCARLGVERQGKADVIVFKSFCVFVLLLISIYAFFVFASFLLTSQACKL
jgi:hypothetical protein